MQLERVIQVTTGLILASVAPAALAHTFGAHGTGFAAGMVHPFTGLDHMLAMIAVGLWAAQLGGRARWAVPLAFMGAMTVGAGLTLVGIGLPLVETGIASSVLVLGLLIACAARLPVTVSATLVAAFAVFHGHAHGNELPQAVSGALYGAGFLLATGTLHAVGLGIGALMPRGLNPAWLRAIGGGIAAMGLVMWIAV